MICDITTDNPNEYVNICVGYGLTILTINKNGVITFKGSYFDIVNALYENYDSYKNLYIFDFLKIIKRKNIIQLKWVSKFPESEVIKKLNKYLKLNIFS